MKLTRNSLVILFVGLCAISAALLYRQLTLKHKLAPSHQARQNAPGDAAAFQAQTMLRAQAARLEARIASHPADVPARQALLLTYQQLGRVDQAMQQLEAIVRLQPKNPDARLTLANARLALKQWPQSEQAFGELTRRWPKDPMGWQGLAAAQFHQGHFQEAAMAARQARDLQPQNPNHRYLLASALLEYAMQYPQPQLHTSALELARSEFEKLTKTWPDRWPLSLQGDIYLRLGRICIATRDFVSAATYLEKAAKRLPNHADVVLFLAKAYTSSGNISAARHVLEQGVSDHPDSADLCDALGQLIQSSAEPKAQERALTLFQTAVRLAPGNERFQERLGAVCLRTNHLDQARQAFEAAILIEPNRAYPFQQLASVYARLKDPKRAAAAAKQSEILNYNAQQLSHLEALVNTHLDDVSLHTTLADRYLFLGDKGAARNEYLTLLRLDPHNRHAKESLAALDRSRPAAMTASTPATP